jgi:hypothetical protein
MNKLSNYERSIRINDDIFYVYPIHVFLSDLLYKAVMRAVLRSREYKEYGSLILHKNKPLVSFETESDPRFMPFKIEINSPMTYKIGYPPSIEVNYVNKNIYINTADLSRMLEADFKVYKKVFCVSVIQLQFNTVKTFFFEAIVIKYKDDAVARRYEDELELVKTKIQTLIKTLKSTNPTILETFLLKYGLYLLPGHSDVLYPVIILIPKGIVNEITDYLLTLYQQGIYTNLPAGFIPNENVQSPELKQFLVKLPLELVCKALLGTYKSCPAVVLPKGDYSQYLTSNEHLIETEEKVVVVFGNPQNIGQNNEEGNSNDLNIAEELGNEILSVYESIIKDDSVNIEEKKNRLEKLNSVLNDLGKAILDALKSQTPLKADELRKYAEEIANAGLSYVGNFEYYLDYYEHSLTETEELETLATLLTFIVKIMYNIDKKIKEYNSQQVTY